ncbi:SH3 domain-containing protein [Enterococcus hirae]|nr:SH3 domain-containing protein [Enterococcus hirae]
MTTSVEQILTEARKYIGVTQGSAEHHSIVNTYNSVKPLPQGYQVTYYDDWCDIFVSFLAIKSGATNLIGRECGVERHIQIFKQLGIWIEDGTIKPHPGDIITFAWSQSVQPNNAWGDHIGIVESVSGNTITTIEGNSGSAVRRNTYSVGHGNIRGFARPSYSSSGNNSTLYNSGSLVNAGHVLTQNNIRLVIEYAAKYNMKPSFLIAQMFIESHWGDPNTSIVGSVDNNWSGISEPFTAPSDLAINMRRGTARPAGEGSYYVHFESLKDYFKAYTFILSKRNGLYNTEGTTSIVDFCKGLFRVGGATFDYAATGYDNYYNLLIPTYNAIKQQNPGKLEAIDSSSTGGIIDPDINNPGTNDNFTRINETGTFYPNTTINVRDYPSTQGNVLTQYTSGDSFVYDSYVINDGYVWLSYIAYSGVRRYVAWRVQGGETFGTIPGGETGNVNRIPETGQFFPAMTINVRDYPSTQGNILAQYTSGDSFYYDSYVINEGYIWLSYISYSGLRRYVAWRVQGGETYGSFNSSLDSGLNLIPQTATFYPNTTINVRDYPSTQGNILAQYTSGESLVYDSYVANDGYVWLSYIASSGSRRYLAWRVQNGETFGTIQ